MCTPEQKLNPDDLGDYSQSEIDDANEKAQFNVLGSKFAIYEYFRDEPVDLEVCECLAELLVCHEEYQEVHVNTLRTLMAKRMNRVIAEEAEKLL